MAAGARDVVAKVFFRCSDEDCKRSTLRFSRRQLHLSQTRNAAPAGHKSRREADIDVPDHLDIGYSLTIPKDFEAVACRHLFVFGTFAHKVGTADASSSESCILG